MLVNGMGGKEIKGYLLFMGGKKLKAWTKLVNTMSFPEQEKNVNQSQRTSNVGSEVVLGQAKCALIW